MAPMAGLRSLLFKNHPAIILRTNQVRGICHKDHMDPEVVEAKNKPWPYETKKFSYWHQYLWKRDRCVQRWDENTKIIVVDGPMAVGKTKFAAELAENLGMRHIKEAHCDQIFITRGGFDYRILNWRIPVGCQFVDLKMFYLNPFHPNLYLLQNFMYRARFAQYMEALVHLYNTGQGVVLERCPQGDFVWAKAMNKMGYLADDAMEYHKFLRRETIWELKRPHLVIWLDIPPEESLKRIKKRNIDYEANSKAMTLEYLETLDELNKEQFLPEIANHAELLMYDWSEGGQDIDLVIEDLEKLDYNQYEKRGERMEDWRSYHHSDYDDWRRYYTNTPWMSWRHFNQPNYDYPSVRGVPEEINLMNEVINCYGPQTMTDFDPNKHAWWKLLFKRDGGKSYRVTEHDDGSCIFGQLMDCNRTW